MNESCYEKILYLTDICIKFTVFIIVQKVFVDMSGMNKFFRLSFLFLLSIFSASGSGIVMGNTLLTMDSEAVGEQYPAEKTEIQKQTDPEENLINESMAYVDGYFSRPKLTKLLAGSRKIILTFDDGPHPRTTPLVLDILRRRNLKAVFFVLGIQAMKYPELLKQIHEEGHIIGNHSFSHKNLARVTSEKLEEEISRTSEIIEKVTGKKPEYMRPPYGAMNKSVLRSVHQHGMKIVLWTVDPKDWQQKSETGIVRSLEKQLGFARGDFKGGAVLLHDIYPSTVRALEPFLDRIAASEFIVSSIDRLDDSAADFWAACPPHIMKKSVFKRIFNVETSGHQLLIGLLSPASRSDRSSMALLKAHRNGNLLAYLVNNPI